jgi:hypothetical protein
MMAKRPAPDAEARRCRSCGERYSGPVHNCGYATVRRDRLRELEAIERRLRTRGSSQACDAEVAGGRTTYKDGH